LLEFLFVRPLLKHAAVVHYTTTEEMRVASPYTFGRPGTVIPLGIYPDEYRPLPEKGSFRSGHPELAGKTLVLFLGRINPSKGLDILARAFGQAARRRDDIHLVVAGPDNGSYRQQVEAWLREDGVVDRATFTGMVTGEDKLAVLRDADLFALTSYSESFGLSVIEAMACGVPVLISDKVKIWRDVIASGAGRVAPCDPARVADAMLEMLADRAELERSGRRGAEVVRRRFTWDVIAEDLERHYYAVLGREPPVPAVQVSKASKGSVVVV
ncbi:MAG TPA: glycosyltransferase, partial [Geminicoccaceae bacterium]|nr:glycosyltransferase [Geminicoccaceae bacterium]